MTATILYVGRALIIGAVALALTGCGGGGGGSTDSGPLPAGTLHAFVDGDQWQYSLAGTESLGGQNFTLTGTETKTVAATTLNGAPVLAVTTHDVFLVDTQSIDESTTSYETQDPITGDIKLVADTQGPGGSLRMVTTQQVVQSGSFGTGTSRSSSVTFDSGQTQSSSESIQGHTFITVPTGTYNTWQALLTKTDTNGISSTDNEWWAPEIGAFIKATVSGTEPGFTIHFTLSLTSTTVVPPSTPATRFSVSNVT